MFGKLDPRGKKFIFICYSEQSKGYVFIGEQPHGSITQSDVNSLEEDFQARSEVGEDIELYKMQDPLKDAPNNLVEDKEEVLQAPSLVGATCPTMD